MAVKRLTIDNQLIFELTAQAKESREKLATCENANVALRTALKSRRKKRATATNKCVATLGAELANNKSLHLQLVAVATCSQTDTSKALFDLQNSQTSFVEVEQEAKLSRKDADKARKQSAGLVKVAEKSLCQLTEMSN